MKYISGIRFVFIGSIVLTLFVLSGCRVRTYTVEKPRTDLEVTGNQGYLSGTPSQEDLKKKGPRETTREISVFEFDIGPERGDEGFESIKAEDYDKDIGDDISEDIVLEEPEEKIREDDYLNIDTVSEEKEDVDEYKVYEVKENDTLQKISRKFYGTTTKWSEIYEANKDVLGSPDQIFPGQTLKIPLE